MRPPLIAIAQLSAFLLIALAPPPAAAQGFSPGSYYWYVPEHEIYGRTQFFSQPTFQSGIVRVTRTQRFKLITGSRGWAFIEFDVAGKAYIHLRVLRNMAYDPTASDPWHEFKRASVFAEEPAKIEARLRPPPVTTSPNVVDSKTPSWKRYKDAWGLKPGRPGPPPAVDEPATDSTRTTARPVAGTGAGKSRNKYPLLPPIGSEPPQEPAPEGDTEAPAR